MEIHWRKLESLKASERRAIEARLQALAHGHSDLIDLRIAGRPTAHHRHGAQEVRITCEVRGKEIIAARTGDDLRMALDQAVDTFESELRRLRARRLSRRSARLAEPPCLGIVDRVYSREEYGFILTDAGDRVYFHRNALKRGFVFEALEEGDRVALDFESGEEGPQAIAVFPAPPDLPSP